MKIDIALLGWNFPIMTLSCLRTVKEKTRMPYRIIWVDNGSKKENFKLIKNHVETFEDYKIFRFEENQYYARGTNKGIELSDSKYVVTLSNDVFVTKKWLTKLIAIMEKRPEIGLISPLTDNIGCNCARASFMIPIHKLLKPDEPHEKINKLPSRFVYCNTNVSMFCAVLRREMIDEIGMLDERLTCWGNDDDYNERVRHSGYKSAVALNCFVSHVHGITKRQIFSPEEKARIRREHRQLLKEKRAERMRSGMSSLRPALKQLTNKHNLTGIEIGVYAGTYTLVYLKELDIEKIFLVDPYLARAKMEGVARSKLKDHEDKIEWVKAKSADVASKFNDESLDFVYIDGNHQYEAVLQDIALYYPKVEKGGLVSGHDYGRRWPGVPKAVNEFCKKNNFKLNTEGIDWWIWK